jgi:hypothetical protein
MGSPRRETQAVHQVPHDRHMSIQTPRVSSVICRTTICTTFLSIFSPRAPLIQGFLNQPLLHIVQLAFMGTVTNLMVPRSPRRIHLKMISPFIQRGQWHPGRLVDLSCGM